MKIALGMILLIFITFTPLESSNAETISDCETWEFRIDCEPSGWMRFIIGEIAMATIMGIGLGYLFYYLSERNQKEIKKINDKIAKIIDDENKLKQNRKEIAAINLKNILNIILFNFDKLQKSVKLHNEKKHKEIEQEIIDYEDNIGLEIKRLRETLQISHDLFSGEFSQRALLFLNNLNPKFAIIINDKLEFDEKLYSAFDTLIKNLNSETKDI